MNFKDHKIAIQFSKQSGIRKIDLSSIPDIRNCHKNDNFLSIIPLLSNSEKIYSVLDNKTIFNQLQKEINIMNKSQYNFTAYSDNVVSVNAFFEEILQNEKSFKDKDFRLYVHGQYVSYQDIQDVQICKTILDRTQDFTLFFTDEKEFKVFCNSVECFTGYDFQEIDDFLDNIKNTFKTI